MRINQKLNVAVIGCGLVGKRRAECAYASNQTKLAVVVDLNQSEAIKLAQKYHCDWEKDWEKVIRNPQIDIVVVSTPNQLLSPIACAALNAGKNVLMEKPMGRNLSEAIQIYRAALKSGKRLKVGFNHRYHPAIQKAYKLFKQGVIGEAMNIRAVYGHGGRPGYEQEWRGNYKIAGGGELTDQGVHLIDLIQWFCGHPSDVFALLQTAFWKIQPSEDNAFVMLRYDNRRDPLLEKERERVRIGVRGNGLIASFHTSWTQWKNQFSFEIFGTKGSLSIHGLGGSYGTETLTLSFRNPKGGAPKQTQKTFPFCKGVSSPLDSGEDGVFREGVDPSWQLEWEDFVKGILHRKKFLAAAQEGLAVMQTLDSIYRSARTGRTAFPFYKGVSR